METSIFSFGEFVSALTLLVIVYTVIDIRYRFRMSIAPFPIFKVTFILMIVIGFGTLDTSIWFSETWGLPIDYILKTILQGIFGSLFLSLALVWINYAFICPPIFNKKNYKIFMSGLFHIISKGSVDELAVIADELGKSASAIVHFSKSIRSDNDILSKNKNKVKPTIEDYAHDLLILIGNPKFCRQIIKSSSITAIEFFNAVTESGKFNLPINQFALNISTEALNNTDSILYYEDHGYLSGLTGYLKPFSKAVYSNYWLVETLAAHGDSPLDISYKSRKDWSPKQLEIYCQLVLLMFESYFEKNNWPQHSYALSRALGIIENFCKGIYKINDVPEEYLTNEWGCLNVVVEFVKDVITLFEKFSLDTIRRLRGNHQKNFYDYIAELMLAIIKAGSFVQRPIEKCWSIQYVSIWSNFFNFPNGGKTWKIIHFKLRRSLYDEIVQMDEFPNYQSARLLAFCLNVMGLEINKKNDIQKDYYPLHKVIINWTKRNYLDLIQKQPDIADVCLAGSITFDNKKSRLIKTYSKGLRLEAPKDYLILQSKSKSGWFKFDKK